MNKRRKNSRKSVKNSPVLFEDEEMGTPSSDDVKAIKTSPTPKSSTGHSTPVRSKADLSEIPDLSYSESPIEQLTQHPPNEVGWDYHRPFSNEENGKSTFTAGITCHTPKRNVLLSKKRNSNSPLLYKPLKKKLHEEQKEDVAGFMEELQAIATNIKLNGERNSEIPKKTEPEAESQLVVEFSQPSDESDIKLQISTNTDDSPGQKTVASKSNNYDAFINDSLENVMVLCSQEVENEFNKKKLPLDSNAYRDKTTPKISPDSSLEKIIKNSSKENVQPKYENEKSNESSSRHSPISKGESCSSEIPDDSFDQFFTEIDDEEFCKSLEINVSNDSTKVKSYTKTPAVPTTSKTSTISNKYSQTKSVSTSLKTQPTLFTSHQSQSVNVSIQNKVMNSNANFGYLNKGNMKNDSSGFGSQASSNDTDKSAETRFLKAKSFSGSNLYMQSSNSNRGYASHNSRSISHLNVNAMKSEQNVNLISISENKGWRRTSSGSAIGQSSNSNTQSSVNRFGGSSSQMHFTPEEIERKRLEALSRREAKKKHNNLATKPIHNPVKR